MNPALRRWRLALALMLAGFAINCAGGGTSEFDNTFVAVVYGRVTHSGNPAAGLSVRGDVYTTSCPSSQLQQTSTQTAQTDADGGYRLQLTSVSQDSGQCLVLTVAGSQPELHTLDQTSFTAGFPGPATDSVRIDVSIP